MAKYVSIWDRKSKPLLMNTGGNACFHRACMGVQKDMQVSQHRHVLWSKSPCIPLSPPVATTRMLHAVNCETHLLGILQIFKQGVVTPGDSRLLVGCRIRVTIGLTRLASKETVQIRSLLVSSTFFNGVALGALGLEDLGSLLFVWSFAHGECSCSSLE